MMTHAKDYLTQYKENKPLWMQLLISEVINTNGNISEDTLLTVYELIKNPSSQSISPEQSSEMLTHSDKPLIIKKLHHKGGINALQKGQIISFSNNCTVLFGLNGSGKSGYFRILHEIIGGSERKEILGNIYADKQIPIDVDIKYTLGKDSNTIIWDNTTRQIEPFSSAKVYDSSYLKGLLSKREVDSTVAEPFGLYLFSIVIDKIEQLKNKLDSEIEQKTGEAKALVLSNIPAELHSLFQEDCLSESDGELIEDQFVFSQDASQALSNLEDERTAYQQNNVQFLITKLSGFRDKLTNIYKDIKIKTKNINSFIQETENTIIKFNELSQKSIEFKQQVKVLNNIPKTDSAVWKNFIKSADEYTKELATLPNNCIYCQQPLIGDAVKIVKAYSHYLDSEVEKNLNQTISALNNLKGSLTGLTFQHNLDNESPLYNEIYDFGNFFDTLRKELLNAIEEKKFTHSFTLWDKGIRNLLSSKTEEISEKVIELDKNQVDCFESIKKLNHKIAPLMQNKLISQNIETISNLLTLSNKIRNLLNLSENIKTGSLIKLSKEAHRTLLTEKMKTNFQEELKEFALQDAGLELKLRNSRDKQMTELILQNSHKIGAILSEGEQKSVALSMFLTELKMEQQNKPVIFDDPVSSLDHKVASIFAERLLKIDNQVIIFSHNKLFLNAFETAQDAHVCKNMDGGCNKKKGKHVFLYKVQSESRDSKGIILAKEVENAAAAIARAKSYLDESPFSKSIEVSSILKKAIEYIIDETVFNNQEPIKYSTRNSRIDWGKLKNIKNCTSLLDSLSQFYSRLSGGDLHLGGESEENPITKEDLNKIANGLLVLQREERCLN